MIPCPSQDLLEALLNDRLAEAEARSVEAHIETCITCQGRVDILVSDPDALRWRSSTDPATPSAPGVETLPHHVGTFGTPGSGPDTASSRYQVTSFLARGALGEVHIAQDQELNREVALKKMQPQYAGHDTSRQRFLLEAHVTGSLEHPGIVPVYGLSTGPDGRPFYAMRLIRGETLKEAIRKLHAGESDSTLRGLLMRFNAVCNAVAYAHSRGVLHRDLKPGNIMLGPFGETLVVDWGLAKKVGSGPWAVGNETGSTVPTDQPLLSTPDVTRAGQVVGTPAYMSPEQAAGRLEELGPASDIYSLGATLYELLTGRAPFVGESDAILKHVEQGEFPPPRQVKKNVPVALEAICLKAMACQPRDRYDSVKTLADDVEKWLADEPVSAYPEGWTARARRWAKRHRTLVAGALTLLFTAAVTLTASSLYIAHLQVEAIRVEKERAEADLREKEAAQREKIEAEKVRGMIDFLVKTFKATDAMDIEGLTFRRANDPGKSLNAQQILEQGIDQARQVFANNSLLKAELLNAVGNVYRSWGDYHRAKKLHEEALALRRDNAAPPLDMAVSLHDLGRCYHDLGHYDKGENLYREALAIQLGHRGEDHPRVTATQFNLAWLLAEKKDPAGEVLLKKVIQTRIDRGDRPRDVAIARLMLACLLSEQGRVWDWDTGQNVVLALRVLYDNELAQAVWLALTAVNARRENRLDESMEKTQTALDIFRKHLGARHPYYGFLLYQSAHTLVKAQKLEQAAQVRQEILDIARETVGFGHPVAFLPVQDQADYLAQQKAVPEGEKLLRELLDKRRELFGDQHPLYAEALARVAVFFAEYGGPERRPEAFQMLAAANRILEGQQQFSFKYPNRIHFSWDPEGKLPGHIDATAFSPDGRRYFGTGDFARAGLYEVTTGQCLEEMGRHEGGVWACAFRPDGKQLLTTDKVGNVRFWPIGPRDAKPMVGEPLPIKGHAGIITNVAYSRDNTRALSCGQDGLVKVWDTANGRLLATLPGPAGDCVGSFLPDGKQVLSGYTDGNLRLWDVETGQLVKQFGNLPKPYAECFVVPDGQRALTLGHDNTVRAWDLAQGQEIRDARRKLDDLVGYRPIAFSNDGRRYVSLHARERVLKLWDADTGKEIYRFELHVFYRQLQGVAQGLSISPDGRYVLCGSVRGLVYLFRLPE